MRELRGAPVAEQILERCRQPRDWLREKNVRPLLAVVRVGDRPDDLSYERGLRKRFAALEVEVRTVALPDDCTQDRLERTVRRLNTDETVHGILLFRPLPFPLREDAIQQWIAPEKDVDCIGLVNRALLFGGREGYAPCTPQAVMELLAFYGVELLGRRATVVGRSMVVGKPLAMLLLAQNATVTMCHTKTVDLAAACREADVLVVCAGSAGMIGTQHVRPGQIIVDVGMNWKDGKLCGDVAYEAVSAIAAAITPVPGGVGMATTAVLLEHTLQSAVRAAKK